jgi:CheY-like chemotaxis protein
VVPFAVSSGEEALKELRVRGPGYYDVALVDYNMGEDSMDGADTVVELLKLDPALRCIGATGNGNEIAVKKAYENAGALGVCAKPFGIEQLRILLELEDDTDDKDPPSTDWVHSYKRALEQLELDTTALQLCLKDLEADVARLSSNPEDWKTAHKLKGDSTCLALQPLMDVASLLEEAGRQGQDCYIYSEALRDAWQQVNAVVG